MNEREQFERWFYASKYAQLIGFDAADWQRAWDAWQARAALESKLPLLEEVAGMVALLRACSHHNGSTLSEAAAMLENIASQVEQLKARLPDVPKREAECKTLDDWRHRAIYLESEWSNCSYSFNKKVGELDARIATLEDVLRQAEGAIATMLKAERASNRPPSTIEKMEQQLWLIREAANQAETALSRIQEAMQK